MTAPAPEPDPWMPVDEPDSAFAQHDSLHEPIGGGRPIRRCIGCGAADDHPKCMVQVGNGPADWVNWHHDCHQTSHGDMDCHPECAGGVLPAPGAAMLAAHQDFHRSAALAADSEES